MPDLWRISNHQSLTGEGGLRYAARWHNAGRRIVYLAESPAGALVEVLVHLELEEEELPQSYTLLRVTVPANVATERITVMDGEAWKVDHYLSRQLGDAWLASSKTALAQVPSAILPNTTNFLLNPRHPDAGSIQMPRVRELSLIRAF